MTIDEEALRNYISICVDAAIKISTQTTINPDGALGND